ncbi:MAG: hypothetical protein H6992_07090 [Pseudomonadales bacterium]|nr:hypothetical protein [Pseudomonadales bacterium]
MRHEKIGADGVVSWCMTVESNEAPWGSSRCGYEFEHIFHQVRHPLKTIPSITTFKETSWRYIEQWCHCSPSDPLMLKAAKYWLHWNERAEEIADWRYRIEDFHDVYPEFCERIGIKPDQSILNSYAKNINTRDYGKLLHIYDELCMKMGIYPKKCVRQFLSGRKAMRQSTPEFTWDQLRDVDPLICDRIHMKTDEYGYCF